MEPKIKKIGTVECGLVETNPAKGIYEGSLGEFLRGWFPEKEA